MDSEYITMTKEQPRLIIEAIYDKVFDNTDYKTGYDDVINGITEQEVGIDRNGDPEMRITRNGIEYSVSIKVVK